MLQCNYCDYNKKLAMELQSPRNPFLCELMKVRLDAEIVRQSVEHPCCRASVVPVKDWMNKQG